LIPESQLIEAKHLNTPRLVADDTQKTVWKWEQQEPFGVNAANDDPDADTVAFEFNLRFPGQYFDKETNAHYNYFRDFDPTLGRYVQSDPIGLRGGLATYAYVQGSPIGHTDRNGLIRDTMWGKIWEFLIENLAEEGATQAGRVKQRGTEIGSAICASNKGNVPSSYTACMAGIGGSDSGCVTFKSLGSRAMQDCVDTCREAIKRCNPKCPD